MIIEVHVCETGPGPIPCGIFGDSDRCGPVEMEGSMNPAERLRVSEGDLAALCARYHVRELAVFGSAAREEAGPDSDLDLLVLFEEDARVTLFTLIEFQAELSELFGQPVDLVPKNGLKPALRREVLAEAQVLYAA